MIMPMFQEVNLKFFWPLLKCSLKKNNDNKLLLCR